MITRRNILGGVAAASGILSSKTAFGSAANSAVSFGIIGTGGRGSYVGTIMANTDGTRLAAVCDIFQDRLEQGRSKIPTAANAKAFKDYHELLAQPGIDAVLISSPVYLHPEHFEAAAQARKHIYCEKPAGASVAGVKRMLRAAQAADPAKTIQFGFQQRFSPEYLKGWEVYQNGTLGEVKLVTSYWVLGGTPPQPFKPDCPPEEEKVRYWGSWMEQSGGFIVEQDCHGVDILNWFAGGHPVSARGTGGLRYPLGYGDQDSDHHDITYYYPKGVEGWLISTKHTAGYRDVKEQVFGSKGLIELTRVRYKLHGPVRNSGYKNADDLTDSSLIERQNSKREITIDAVEAFFKSIANGKPHNMAQVAADATFTSLLGRAAYQQKREVTWDELLQSA